MAISYVLGIEQMMHEKCDMQLSFRFTLEPRYNDPFNNKIPAIKNIISSLSVVKSIVEKTTNNKTPALKNKILGPFRFVKLRFPCTIKSSKDMFTYLIKTSLSGKKIKV
jgi:hypothetical protein